MFNFILQFFVVTILLTAYSTPLEALDSASITPNLLLIYVSGGWDAAMVFDPKLDSGYINVEPKASLATGAKGIKFVDHPDRPSVKSWFTTFGSNAGIINGIYVGSLDRDNAAGQALSIAPPGKIRAVDWLTYYAANINPTLVMPHVIIDAPYIPGSYSSVAFPLSTATIKSLAQAPTPITNSLGNDIENRLSNYRKAAFNSIASLAKDDSLDGDKIKAITSALTRDSIIRAVVKDSYKKINAQPNDSDFLNATKLAINFFADNVSLCATIQYGLPGQWDTYTAHFAQQSLYFENLFRDLTKMMAYAQDKKVISKLTIIVLSERGRAPMLNAQNGKNPWPFTSMLVWGPGIRGGLVSGLTDAALRGLPIDPVFGSVGGGTPITIEMSNVFAALYLRYDIPVKLIMPDVKPLSSMIEAAKS